MVGPQPPAAREDGVAVSRRAVLVVVALAVAALSTALLTVYVRGANDRAAQGNDLQQVLVASELLEAGQTGQQVLDSGLVVLENVPESAVVEGAMSSMPDSLTALRLDADVYPGEQLNRNRFRAGVVSRLGIPETKLAVSIELDDAARVAGNVESGADVAVFVSLAGDGTGATKLLIPRIEVLSTGTPSMDGEEGGGTLLTLAADQTEAQQLIYAQTNGDLYVALLDEKSVVGTQPETNSSNLFPAG